MKKAAFFDRDGTINFDKGYLYKIEGFEFIPGVLDTLINIQNFGYKIVVISNQSGVARGFYTEVELANIDTWMKKTLENKGVVIAGSYYCPHLPDAKVEKYNIECNCRKPKTGLFYKASEDLGIDIDQSIAIGDKLRDCCICIETQCKGFLVGNNEDYEVIKAVKEGKYHNIVYIEKLEDVIPLIGKSLKEAADIGN